MSARIALSVLPVLPLLLGACASQRLIHTSAVAGRALAADDHANCVKLYTQLVEGAENSIARTRSGDWDHADALGHAANGQRGRSICLKALGKTEELKPALLGCVDRATKAIDEYAVLKRKPSPGEVKQYMLVVGPEFNLFARAYCNKELGRLAEAVADKEAQLPYLNAECHFAFTWVSETWKQKVCQQLADESEVLAKWKKELEGPKP